MQVFTIYMLPCWISRLLVTKTYYMFLQPETMEPLRVRVFLQVFIRYWAATRVQKIYLLLVGARRMQLPVTTEVMDLPAMEE